MTQKNDANKYHKRILVEVCILFAFLFVVLMYLIGLHKADLTVPMNFSRGGTGELFTRAKLICTGSWTDNIVELGAPFNTSLITQPGFLAQLIDAVFLKLLYVITGNVAVALNLQMILSFFIMAFSSFAVMKKLKMSSFSCILGSLTFAASTYVFMMAMTEYGMMSCYFVPLAVLLGIWIYENENFFKPGPGFFHNRKNYLAMGLVILMCFNGAGYYAFFSGVILLTAGISGALKGQGKKCLFKSLILVGIMLAVNILLNIPYLTGGGTFYPYASPVATAEIKGLKLIQMFLPVNNLGIGFLGTVINSYYKYTIVRNSLNISSFLGIVGIIGFAVLIAALVTGIVKKKKNSRYMFIAEAVLVLMLVCETGGIGALITGIFNGGLTDYAKGIIFIIYLSIISFFMAFEWLVRKSKYPAVIAGIVCLITGGSVLIQQPAQFSGFYGDIKEQYMQEEAFVAGMETELGENSRVYQPAVVGKYTPVGGIIWEYNNRSTGFFLSNKLCWNIDVQAGYDPDGWRNHLKHLPVDQLVEELRNAGFTAIFIDKSNYVTTNYRQASLTELYELENQLKEITGNEFVVGGNLEYIRL